MEEYGAWKCYLWSVDEELWRLEEFKWRRGARYHAYRVDTNEEKRRREDIEGMLIELIKRSLMEEYGAWKCYLWRLKGWALEDGS